MNLAVFDIGGSAVKYGYWKTGELTHVSQFKTPETYAQLKKQFQCIIHSFPEVKGVAISAPGAVNTDKRRIDGISAVPYLHRFPIFDDLEQSLGMPITIENDANCAGICEAKQGAGKGVQNMVFVVLGTGVGGAIFINGQLYKGSHLFAGEFGLMKNKQEKIFSLNGTAVKAAEEYNRQTKQLLTGKELFEQAAFNHVAAKILECLYETIADGLYNIQVSLDPSLIVIGGAMSARSEMIAAIRTRLFEKLTQENVAAIMPEVKACHYLNNANLIGAGQNFMLNKPI